jgi:hypothetical protein
MKINPEDYEDLEPFVKIKSNKVKSDKRPFRILACNKEEYNWVLHSSYNHKNERDKAFHSLVMSRHAFGSTYYKKFDL